MRLFLSIFGGVAALMLGITVVASVLTIRAMQETEARIAQLSFAGATAVGSGPVGREVVIEGRISARMRPLRGNLVAYYSVLPSQDPEDSDSYYGPEALPPLLVETADGTVEVRGRYRLDVAPRTLPGEEAATYYGVAVGETVAVAGTAASAIEMPTLDGTVVFSPPTNRYAEMLRGKAREGWIGVAICAVVGAAFGGFALLFRRVFAGDI